MTRLPPENKTPLAKRRAQKAPTLSAVADKGRLKISLILFWVFFGQFFVPLVLNLFHGMKRKTDIKKKRKQTAWGPNRTTLMFLVKGTQI